MTAAGALERVVRATPARPALLALVVQGVLLAGCREAEPASRAELCAAIRQVGASAAAALADAPSATASERRTLSYSFGEDVQSAREIGERQSGGLAPASLTTLLTAGEGAAAALRRPGADSYSTALQTLRTRIADEAARLDCPA